MFPDDLGDPGLVGDGAIVVALGTVGEAAVVVGADVLRIDLDGLGVVGDGAVVVALGARRLDRGCSRHRRASDRSRWPWWRPRWRGRCRPWHDRRAAVVEGARQLGIDLDGLGVVRNGAVVVALGPVGDAAVVVGAGNSGSISMALA